MESSGSQVCFFFFFFFGKHFEEWANHKLRAIALQYLCYWVWMLYCITVDVIVEAGQGDHEKLESGY